MFCSNCGRSIPENNRFCSHCGAQQPAKNEMNSPSYTTAESQFNEAQTPDPQTPKATKKSPMKTVGIVLLCLQGVSILGGIANGSLGSLLSMSAGATGFAELLGFFLPAIVGAILLIKANKKAKQ